MKKWIVLGIVWAVFIGFDIGVCFSKTYEVTIPDELTAYIDKTVDIENTVNVGKEGYPINANGYLSKIMIVSAISWKDKIQKEALEVPELKDAALKMLSLSQEKQAELKAILDAAVEANK